MAGFHEVRFPTDVSLGARGGPERKTEIATMSSGFEERNQVWANSRRKWNAGYGVKSFAQLESVLAFFEERRGRFYGFRWKDRLDWKSCSTSTTTQATDQAIGTGDGSTATFQLAKKYGASFAPWTRTIKKPVAGTVKVAVAGVKKTLGTHFTVDTTTGVVTFVAGSIPAAGQAVTAGFEFDVPVRFDTDYLEADLSAFEAGSFTDIPIIELRL